MGIFLYSKEIKGDATEADHVGEIELESAQFSNSDIGGGPGSGRPVDRETGGDFKQREVYITKKQDRASSGLLKAARSGQIFGFMILDFVSKGRTVRNTIQQVVVSSFSVRGDGFEDLTLNFTTISFKVI